MIPSIPYPGGKGRWAAEIVSHLPAGGLTYVEPFAGRLNIFLAEVALNPGRFKKYHLNDLIRVPFYESILTYSSKLKMPTNLRSSYYKLWHRNDHRARLLEPLVSRDGGGYGTGGPAGDNHANPKRYKQSLLQAQEILLTTRPTFTAKDWSVIGLNRLSFDDVVVLDPPYRGADIRAYTSKGFDYEGLITLLKRAKFRWLLMEYGHPSYIEAFGKPFYVKVVGQGSSRQKGNKIECMWKNY